MVQILGSSGGTITQSEAGEAVDGASVCACWSMAGEQAHRKNPIMLSKKINIRLSIKPFPNYRSPASEGQDQGQKHRCRPQVFGAARQDVLFITDPVYGGFHRTVQKLCHQHQQQWGDQCQPLQGIVSQPERYRKKNSAENNFLTESGFCSPRCAESLD